jgi:hypothetical protein
VADDIDTLLEARASSKGASADDIDSMLEARSASPTSSAPAQIEAPWWQKALKETGRQAALTGRAVTQGIASIPMMAMDAGVSARNLVENAAHGVYPSWQNLNPFSEAGYAPGAYGHELPSQTFNKALTDVGVPEPKTTSEKVASFIESTLAGSRIPSPQAKTQAPTGFVRPAATQAEQVLRESRDAGYVVPPTTTKPTMVNKLAEGFAGKLATAQTASIKNQEVTNELVRKALDMQKGAPITPESLKSIRDAAGKVYEQIGDAGDIMPDAEYLKDLAQLGRGADEIASAFPGANVGATKQINEVVDSLLQDKFSSKAALQYLRELRKQASGNLSGMNAVDPAKQALGMAQREAASTLEDLIQRHLTANGMEDLANSFGAARRAIAMSHSVESALNETTGNVIAGKLTQQMAKGKPLSGELETVARFGQAFPKAAKEVTESIPGVSPLDWALAIGSSVAAGHVAPLASVMARPGMRSALLSPWWQQSLTDAVPYAAPPTIGLAPSAALQGGDLARP